MTPPTKVTKLRSPRKVSEPAAPQARVGRADLLRLLAAWGDDGAQAAAQLTGFVYHPPEPAPPRIPKERPPQKKPSVGPTTSPPPRAPLRAVHCLATVQTEAVDELPSDYLVRLSNPSVRTDPATLAPRPPPPAQLLSAPKRLVVFAEKQLRRPRPGNQWNVPALVRSLGAGLPPNQRARQPLLRWCGNAVVLELCAATDPLRADYLALAQLVHSRSGVRIPIYTRTPDGAWQRFAPLHHPLSQWLALAQPPHLKGIGGLAVGLPQGRYSWPQGWQPHTLLNAGQDLAYTHADHTPSTLPHALRQHVAWELGQTLRPRRSSLAHDAARAASSAKSSLPALPQLLALCGLAVLIEPPLLRALRGLLSLPVAAELQAWHHPDMACDRIAIALRTQHRERYLAQLEQLPLVLRQRAAECIEAHHANLAVEICVEEAQLAQVYAPGARVPEPSANWAFISQAQKQADSIFGTQGVSAYLLRAGMRASEAVWAQSAEFAGAWAYAAERADSNALTSPAFRPPHMPSSVLQLLREAMGKPQPPLQKTPWVLRQQDDCIQLTQGAAAHANALPRNVLAQGEAKGPLQWRSAPDERWQDLPGSLSWPLPDGSALELSDGQATCTVQMKPRPRWALEWGRDQEGIYALLPNPWDVPWKQYLPLVNDGPPLFRLSQLAGQDGAQTGTFTFDIDGKGPLATLQLDGTESIQSFRYLPPGSFLMGSPENENKREEDEGPQHWVTFTQGLWLADTACTQSLWRAVMGGKNPSHFTGDPQLPVEQVSWDDVQGFLTRLQIFMPQGVQAVLPTEAEWEYACRADSTTQFSFGDVIGSQQVNFNGSYTGVIVDKGESRGTTIPVRALAPNHWGLYQMHGNVREWCADSLRQYSSELEINPTGASDQQVKSFAVRGGSWFHDALNSRSALRYFNQRFRHNFDLGFRIALRTTERGLRSSILDVGGRRQLEALDAPDSWDKA